MLLELAQETLAHLKVTRDAHTIEVAIRHQPPRLSSVTENAVQYTHSSVFLRGGRVPFKKIQSDKLYSGIDGTVCKVSLEMPDCALSDLSCVLGL